ncbi:hypothetical protein SFC65_24140 [Priestia filamentosa]|uniref:hypothetical protein n=1 Tax=Priestia filamentosa TaxID=1402861 RepID=UPI003982A173
MFSIEEYGLDYYIPVNCQKEYEKIANSSLSVSEKIMELLTVNPGFMTVTGNNREEKRYKSFKYKSSLKIIQSRVDKEEKLVFFSLSFNTKPHIGEITNGLVYPDAADFLTLLHLNLSFKYINQIYKPGAELRIGSQFVYFRKFNVVSVEQAKEMTNMVYLYNDVAEKLVGTSDKVKIFDIYQEISPIKKEFFLKVEQAKLDIIQEEKGLEEIRKGADYYMNFVLDERQFPNKEAAWNFCMYHTLDSAAYKRAVLTMGDFGDGLFKGFSHTIMAETRFQTGSNLVEYADVVYISFLPGASTYAFNRLTLHRADQTWELATYQHLLDIKADERFVKELKHPFFFVENKNGQSI